MNSQDVLKKTLKRGTGWMITWIVFAVLAVVFLIIGFIPRQSTPVPITPQNDENGLYGYLDLYSITESFAEDNDGLDYFLVCTSDDAYYMVADYTSIFYSKYKELLDWSYDMEAGDDVHPGIMRVTGVLTPMEAELVEYGAEYMEMTETDFTDAFGSFYLDVTAPSPSSNSAWMWFTFAFFSGLMALCFGIVSHSQAKPAKQTLRRLAATGETDAVAQELNNPANLAYPKNKVIFTDHYLVAPAGGAIVRYEDILWCYITVQRTYFVATAQFLTIKTANRETFNIAGDKPGNRQTGIARGTMEEIARRNPSVLLGHTTDNVRAYNSRLASLSDRVPARQTMTQPGAQQLPNATSDLGYLGNIGGDSQPNHTDYTNNGDPTIR